MSDLMEDRKTPERDGLSLIIVGVLAGLFAVPFFFSFSYLGALAYPLLLAGLLTLGFGLAKRARVRGTSVAAAWVKAVVYITVVAALAFFVLLNGPW